MSVGLAVGYLKIFRLLPGKRVKTRVLWNSICEIKLARIRTVLWLQSGCVPVNKGHQYKVMFFTVRT